MRQHLVIEDEVVAIFRQWQPRENFPAERAIARVIFGKLDPQEKIFKRSQQAVGDVFVNRHAPAQSRPADDARAQHHIVDAVGDHARQRRNQQRRVLIIRMHHDHDVRARRQSFAVASLLVAPVAVVAVVDKTLQSQAVRHLDSPVGTVVIHQNADIHQLG